MPLEADPVHVRNSKALARISAAEMQEHRGQFALLVDGAIESYHATNKEALQTACKRFGYGQFSVQRVEPQPVDIGFIDCANYPR